MDIWHAYLLSAACATSFWRFGDWRAMGWVAFGGLMFAISDWYGNSGLPFPEAFNFSCDTVQVLLIYFLGRYGWEKPGLWRIWQGAMLWSAMRFFWPKVFDHLTYVVGLEILNYAALVVIAAAPWFGRLGFGRQFRRRRSIRDRILRSLVSLCEEREDTPFHKQWRKVP